MLEHTICQFETKTVYGRDLFYPLNDAAKAFAELLRRKALTQEEVAIINHKLKYRVEIRYPEIKLEEPRND